MSDLLNSASLVMIPSGYKEDVVYSQIPTSGAGDLTFTRASNGTRVNNAGLVEVCPWNLIDNSQTFSSWSKVEIGQTVTVTDNFVTAPNGTLTGAKVVFSQFSSTAQIFANYSLSPTQNLTATLYAKVPSGTRQAYFGFYDGSGKVELKTLTTEWQRIEYTGSVTAGSIRACWFYGDGGASNVEVHLWGGQLNIGSTAKPYFPTTDRLNVPRLTYQNGGGGCPSLLLEKQSTNLVYPSEDFSAWNLYLGATISTNTTISPDGTQNADTLNFGVSSASQLYSSQGTGTSATYTASIYAKSSSGKKFRIKFSTPSGDLFSSDFTTTSEWQRFTYTYTERIYQIGISNESAGGTGTIQIWGAQLEESSYPTSYIPTTSSSATRLADECYKTGISSLIGQTSGSVFLDFTVDTISGQTNFPVLWYMKDGGSGERYVQLFPNGNLLYNEYDGVSIIAQITKSGLTVGRHKCAIAYAPNDMTFYVDGVQIGTDTSGTPSGFSTFGFQYYASVYNSQQKVNQTVIFPTRLTNAELALLTTL